MRLSVIATSALVLAALGCEPPPAELTATFFTKALDRHFSRLNNDAHKRREDMEKDKLLHERNPEFPKPTGYTYSTYYWTGKIAMQETGEFNDDGSPIMRPMADEQGNPVIITDHVAIDYPCQIPGCGTKLLLTIPSAQYLCPSCGHNPFDQNHDAEKLHVSPCELCVGEDLKVNEPSENQISLEGLQRFELDGAKVRQMFALTQTNPEQPLRAKVFYIRRVWSYDARGAVTVSEKALQAAGGVSREWLPSPDGMDNSAPGFHRLDSTYVGEVDYIFEGGQLRQVGKAKETAVRPWKDIKIPQ